jgi:replication factor C small subunit
MQKREHYILNERYRPKNMDGFVCEDSFKSKVESWIEEQNIPHLFLYGKPGSGKSTLAKIIAQNIDCDYLMVNATDKRGMDDIRNEILPFVSVMSFKNAPKIVILDEATHILQASQVLLLNMIETYSLNTRFILTGNYPERLIEPLRSRLEDYNLKPPSKKSVAKHLDTILRAEGVEFDIKDVAQVIHTYYPDIRRTINNVQKYIIEDKFVLPKMKKNGLPIDFIEGILADHIMDTCTEDRYFW